MLNPTDPGTLYFAAFALFLAGVFIGALIAYPLGVKDGARGADEAIGRVGEAWPDWLAPRAGNPTLTDVVFAPRSDAEIMDDMRLGARAMGLDEATTQRWIDDAQRERFDDQR